MSDIDFEEKARERRKAILDRSRAMLETIRSYGSAATLDMVVRISNDDPVLNDLLPYFPSIASAAMLEASNIRRSSKMAVDNPEEPVTKNELLNVLGRGEPKEFSSFISLLLPYYLDECFRHLFEGFGFSVIHSYDKDVVEKAVRSAHIDIALEWQYGREDYPIRDLLRKYDKRVPILLCLNWDGQFPPNFSSLGYQGYLNVPWTIDELMSKFYKVLPESKKPILKVFWKRCKEK